MNFFKRLFAILVSMLSNNKGMANETTSTTMTEAIPTAVGAALLEMEEGDVVRPLVVNVPFSGPGLIHSTPIISKLTSETDDSHANQAIDSGTYTGSPSQATAGMHGSTVFLKEIASLGMGDVNNLMAIAGQLIGQSVVTRRDLDLVTLFTSITVNQGSANVDITPSDLFDAYASLRSAYAPQPYSLVMRPEHVWSSVGIITFFSNVADSAHFPGSAGVGTVGEDFVRNGFAGRIFGFDLYVDGNITTTSNNASGAAFSRDAIKYVEKRPFRIDVLYDPSEVGWEVTGSGAWGESILKNNFGNEMQFNLQP